MSRFRIESIELNHIGPFEHQVIKFPKKEHFKKAEIHILTGENGTGKTTILETLAEPLNSFYETSTLAKKTDKNNRKVSFTLKINDELIDGETWTYTKRNDAFYPLGSMQWNHFSGLPEFLHAKLIYDDNLYQSYFFCYSGYRKISNTDQLDSLESPFKNATSFAYSTNSGNLLKWISEILTKELIVRGKGELEKATVYKKTLEVVERALSEIIESEVTFALEESLNVVINVNGKFLDFDQLPDGLRSIISWIADLLMRLERITWYTNIPATSRDFILLLDEIEIHLHPSWQRKILPVIQKLFPNAQIFVSTHSPFVVGSVDGASVHKFKKADGSSVLDGPPTWSEDSNSYDYILEEIFGIKERFGVEVERKLSDFKTIKNLILSNQNYDPLKFQTLIKELISQGKELESIIGMELNQLKRIKNKDFAITE